MILAAAFTVSLASLCYEVLLTRFFSFSQWNHLSFMVISIVLFGFGASGSVLSLAERRRPGWSARALDTAAFTALLPLFSLATSASFLAVKNIPLDYFRMPLDWHQGVYLLATFLILMVPFFCAGGVMSLAFAGSPDRSGWIYFASMLGSAAGALLPALLLPLLGEGRIVLCCALLPPLVALLQWTPRKQWKRRREAAWRARLLVACSAVVFLLIGGAVLREGGRLLEISPSPYKLLPQVLQFPDTAIVGRSNTIRGRLDRLESPYIRFAPGLSLKYQGELPGAVFLVQDGDALFVLYDLSDPGSLQFSRFLHSYAGYVLRAQAAPPEVLILQRGGGLSLPCAVSAGAGRITVLIEHPEAAALLRARYAGGAGPAAPPRASEGPAGGGGSGANIRVRAGGMRRYLARHGERYDRVQLEAWGPSVPGMASLDQEHLLTVEAFSAYLEHLKPEGILTVSRKLLLPPSDTLKVFGACYRALAAAGLENPGAHILMVRGWDSFTVLCSPTPFTPASVGALRDFCRRMNFDLVFYEGMEEGEANVFNAFAEAYHFQEIQKLYAALRAGRARQYYRSYYLDIAPSRDDRPFHSRFTRWLKIGALFRATGRRFYTLLLSGETVLLSVLAVAGLLGAFLLLLPRLLPARRRRSGPGRAGPGGGGRSTAAAVFFLAAGAGFMLVEMAFVQGYTFLFDDPVIAFTVVLAELLVMSGIGGALSANWRLGRLRPLLAILAVFAAALFVLYNPLLEGLMRASTVGRAVGSFLLLAPVALLMGAPFPVGLRLLLASPRRRAYGWAANGVASVLASIAAVALAMSWGISLLLLAAAACYLLMLGMLPLCGAKGRRGGPESPT
jgi:hypothetical protein